MTYKELISICRPIEVFGGVPGAIGALQQDSRLLQDNDVFIAVRGYHADGHNFIWDAVAKGASVIICEDADALAGSGNEATHSENRDRVGQASPDRGSTSGSKTPPGDNAAIVVVESTRELLGKLAQAFRGNPADRLTTIAVTGTNGKTTVATLVWQVLQNLGVKTGLLGTVTKQYGDIPAPSRLTTADPVEIAADMKKMVDTGCTAVAMEVSSHALEQSRTAGIHWSLAAFTNLSHDHLDYHKNMDSYVAAKRKLFGSLGSTALAVVNMDDPYALRMTEDCNAEIIDFAFHKNASVTCRLAESGKSGLSLLVGNTKIETPLTGTFNAYNVAQTFLICTSLGYDARQVAGALKICSGAPGRLEKVNTPGELAHKPAVFVDYAHTPDALENVAVALKGIKEENQPLIILFGCGGDRDIAKRPVMAKIAETHGDRIVVTSDNPRTEPPGRIIRDIEAGFSGNIRWTSIQSREQAIREAILNAPEKAIILIAGKGHETYQEVNGEKIHFDDREIARNALAEYDGSIKSAEGH